MKQKSKWTNFMQERDIHNMNTDIMEKKDDCVLMINYLSNIGKPIEESLLQDVARISVFVDNSLVKSEGNEDSGVEDIYSLVLKTHNKLSLLSKPANAVSIKCTEYSRGFLLKTNKTVNSIMIVTILSLLLYIICKTDIILTQGDLKNVALIILASALGAGFYTLSTVRNYIISRTYDPRYNPSYLIRFFLGVTAGIILSLILQDAFEMQEYNFGAESLAVVGGFAADAVSVILTRISEILISVVKGNESDSSDKEIINKKSNLIKQKSQLKGIEELNRIKKIINQDDSVEEIMKQIDISINSIETA